MGRQMHVKICNDKLQVIADQTLVDLKNLGLKRELNLNEKYGRDIPSSSRLRLLDS